MSLSAVAGVPSRAWLASVPGQYYSPKPKQGRGQSCSHSHIKSTNYLQRINVIQPPKMREKSKENMTGEPVPGAGNSEDSHLLSQDQPEDKTLCASFC